MRSIKPLRLWPAGVFPLDDGHTAHVRSQSDPTVSHLVNGTCDCKATQYHAAPCAHRLAFRVYQRTVERLTVDPEERWEPVETPTAAPIRPRRQVPAKYIQTLQGKDFVRFAGLLHEWRRRRAWWNSALSGPITMPR